MNNESTEIGAADTYTLYTKLTEETNDVTLSFVLDGCTGNWVS